MGCDYPRASQGLIGKSVGFGNMYMILYDNAIHSKTKEVIIINNTVRLPFSEILVALWITCHRELPKQTSWAVSVTANATFREDLRCAGPPRYHAHHRPQSRGNAPP